MLYLQPTDYMWQYLQSDKRSINVHIQPPLLTIRITNMKAYWNDKNINNSDF